MRKLKEKLQGYMLRPFLYMTFTRLALGLFAALILHFFLSDRVGRDLRGTLFLLAGIIFALLAWIAYLRLDGITLPKMLMLRLKLKKKTIWRQGDIIDYVDEEPSVDFDDLDDAEKDICLLGADAVCCAVFLIASFFFS